MQSLHRLLLGEFLTLAKNCGLLSHYVPTDRLLLLATLGSIIGHMMYKTMATVIYLTSRIITVALLPVFSCHREFSHIASPIAECVIVGAFPQI